MKKTDINDRSAEYQFPEPSTRHQTASRIEQASQAHERGQLLDHQIHSSDHPDLSREAEGGAKAVDREEVAFIGYRAFRQLHYPELTPLMLIENPALRHVVRRNRQHEVRMMLERAHRPRFWTTAQCVPTEHCWLFTKREDPESGKIRVIAKTDVRKTQWFRDTT